MKCCQRAVLTIAILGCLAAVANAQVPPGQYQNSPPQSGGWWDRLWADYHRNHAWPDPFVAGDRVAVNAPFAIMAENGWRRQNLLCDYHFSDGGFALNQAGEYQLNWVLTKAPTQRRTVYVQRGPTASVTNARIDAVQQMVARMVPSGPLPPVVETNLDSNGYSGEDVDAVWTNAKKSSPDPRLPGTQRAAINN
jgi:hypothetical protein